MPDFDDLRSEFESQPSLSEKRMSEIATLVRERSDRLESVLNNRDRTEFAAALFVGVAYGLGAILFSSPLAKVGGLIAVLGCIEIVVLMKLARRPADPHAMAGSLDQSLSHEVTMVDRQIWLLRHVAWWYILPLYVGSCVFVAGISSWSFAAIFAAGYFFLCYRIWQANQTARQQNLEPLRDRLLAAREAVANPDATVAIPDDVIRDLSKDTFDQAAVVAHGMAAEQSAKHTKDTLSAVGRFFDAVIVFVLMSWGGMVAGGMIDAVIAGKHPAEGEDGVFSMIGFFAAAAYAIWTKASNWIAVWKLFAKPTASSDDANRGRDGGE